MGAGAVAYDYDLVVIGCGPAGEKGAAQAAYFGKRVAVVECADDVGGAGLNTGTVPSKTLRETALYYTGLRQRGLYGIDYSLRDGMTVNDFMFRKEQVIRAGRALVHANLERHGIDLHWGRAALADAHIVVVTGREGQSTRFTTEFVLVATGSSPHRPGNVPFDERLIHDSDSILRMARIPSSLAVAGGGVIGCEYASVFCALGVKVTLIEGRGRLLPFVDGEVAERLREQLDELGLRFIFNQRVTQVDTAADRVSLTLTDGEVIECENALFAAGRQSNTAGLGLAEVGVEMGERGLVKVNEHYQTNVPNLYAAGDVIGFPALASVSMEQARVAMVHAFDLGYKERVSPVVPLAVYTVPEIALVGLTEEACADQGIPYLCGRAFYQNNARGQIIGDTSGMIKLIFSPTDGQLLGAHLIGELASELVHIAAQVLGQGGGLHSFIDTVFNFPSLSDLFKYAAYDGLGAQQRWRAGENNRDG